MLHRKTGKRAVIQSKLIPLVSRSVLHYAVTLILHLHVQFLYRCYT